jgi:hypothetical protein
MLEIEFPFRGLYHRYWTAVSCLERPTIDIDRDEELLAFSRPKSFFDGRKIQQIRSFYHYVVTG